MTAQELTELPKYLRVLVKQKLLRKHYRLVKQRYRDIKRTALRGRQPTTRTERDRHNHYIRKYGLSGEDVEKLKSLQNSQCAICKLKKPLEVDHCHSSKKVRGMLCSSCNRGLGQFRDRADIMQSAIHYIRLASKKQQPMPNRA